MQHVPDRCVPKGGALDLMTANPDCMMIRPVVVQGCTPADDLGHTHFASGMKRRIREHSQQLSTALLEQCVKWIDDLAENQLCQAFTPKQRKAACQTAIISDLLGWLGWLQAMDSFSLQLKDVFSVEPWLGPTVGLPESQGMVLLRLLAQTKSQQSVAADVVLARSAASGFSIGKWFGERLGLETQDKGLLPVDCILAHDNGQP
jgi:hypothetical protein